MEHSFIHRSKPNVPGASARPWRKAIVASVLTSSLSDPAPVATKVLTADGARHCVMAVDQHTVMRLMFGGSGAADKKINWQAILWTEVISSLEKEAWIGRVVGNGVATLGAETYAVAGLGATTNRLADTITDTLTYSRRYSPADDSIAVIELPLFNAELIEIQTDLPSADAVTNADAWVQLGERSGLDLATEDKQTDILVPLGNLDYVISATYTETITTSGLLTAAGTFNATFSSDLVRIVLIPRGDLYWKIGAAATSATALVGQESWLSLPVTKTLADTIQVYAAGAGVVCDLLLCIPR